MRLVPLYDRVLLERNRPEKIGNIHIPESVQIRNAPTRGTVIAVGNTADPQIEEGKTYVFGQHAGTWINSEGKPIADGEEKRFFICEDRDLLCEVIDE